MKTPLHYATTHTYTNLHKKQKKIAFSSYRICQNKLAKKDNIALGEMECVLT